MGGAVSSGRDNDELIDNLMSGNYIRSKEVERVFRALDRAEYMTPEAREQAYKDLAWRNGPLHLSSPCIYSEVMEGLELKRGLSFLNIGSGTGYLSTLAGLILGTAGISHGVEVHPAVVEYATKKIRLFFENSAILDDFDFCEPKFYHGNGLCLSQLLCGYDRVYCGAGCPVEYEDYFKRLIKVGGILVMPLNDCLLQVRRVGEDKWTSRNLLSVSFATLRIPTAEEADDKVNLDKQTPVRLMYLARATIRESMRGGVTRRHPELREPPRPRPPTACPRRICIPLEPEGELEGLNVLHDLDSENGANEMNALLSLVISMGQNRGAGALRFDRITPSDSEDEDDDTPDRPDPDNGPQDNPKEDNDNQDNHNQHNNSQENRNQGNDNQVNHNHGNDNQDNPNQNNDQPDNHSLVNDNPDRLSAAERFPDGDPGSKRIDSDNSNNDLPRIRGSGLSNGLLGGTRIDSDDEEYLRKTFDKSLSEYPYINTIGMRWRDSYNTDRGCSNNNTTDSRPDDPVNAASTSTSDNKSGGNAVSKAGNSDDDRRPRANSTDEDKSSTSRKSGRTRTLFGTPRDPALLAQCESEPGPSTSSAEADKSAARTLDTMVREAVEHFRGPQRAHPRPDPPGMPSEVEIDLGKMAATGEEMAWDETRRDSVEASEEDTDTSNSKPKRQKLDSGIGEASPSGSSTEKTKSENSDTDSPLHSDCPIEDAEASMDRLRRARSPSYWSASPEELAHRERMRRQIAQGGDARRARLSYLMKQAVRELPLPHALKKFYEKYGLPGVIGCIDCTHIAIVRPSEHEEQYFNRKHFHSLNTQVICDSDCYITNVDASFGGATHDAYIWRECDIRSYMEGLQNETVYLLGDSGYAQREYMMTPIDNAVEDSPEGRYNYIQKRARSTIERTFGILKGRWRCLLAARELHYCPETAGKIIIACCVLHNLCTRGGIDVPELTEEELQAERSRQVPAQSAASSAQALQAGRRARAALVQLLERNR